MEFSRGSPDSPISSHQYTPNFNPPLLVISYSSSSSSLSPLSPSGCIGHPQSASSESYSEPTSSHLPMTFLPFQFPPQLFFFKSVSVFLSAYYLEDSNPVFSLIHCLFLMYCPIQFHFRFFISNLISF